MFFKKGNEEMNINFVDRIDKKLCLKELMQGETFSFASEGHEDDIYLMTDGCFFVNLSSGVSINIAGFENMEVIYRRTVLNVEKI